MKNNHGKKIQPNFFMRPIMEALIAAFSLALLITLASWRFELRSTAKWLFQASMLTIPIWYLSYILFYRKNPISIDLDLPQILIATLTSALLALMLVPAQQTLTRSILVVTLTAFLFFSLYSLFILFFLKNAKISWRMITIWVIFVSGLVGIALIIKNSYYARLYSDDFCYAVNYDQLGFPGAALFFYRDWSGRLFSNFLVMGLTDQPRTIIYLIILTIFSLFGAILVVNRTEPTRQRWLYALTASLFLTLTIAIAAPDFYKSFFWICSALILFPAFIMIPVDLTGAFRLIRAKSKYPTFLIIISGLLSFCIATTHEVSAMAWLALNGIGLLWALLRKTKIRHLNYFFIVAIIATLVGVGVLLSSPGIRNRAQIQQYPGATPILQTIPILFKNFFELFHNIATPYYTFESSGRPGWLLIIGAVTVGWLADLHLPRKWGSVLIVLAITIASVFAASFPAAYVYRGNIPLRTQMIPVFFLTMGAFIIGALMPMPKKNVTYNAILLFFITAVLLGMRVVVPQMLSIMEPLQQYASDWDERDQQYIQSTGIPPRIDIPWDEYEQNIDCIELYYAHLTDIYGSN